MRRPAERNGCGRLPVLAEAALKSFPDDAMPDLRLVVDALPVLIGYVDTSLRYRFANREHLEWFLVSPEAARGRTLAEVWGAAGYVAVEPHLRAAIAGETSAFDSLIPLPAGDRHIHASFMPDRGTTGAIHGVYLLIADITDRQRALDLLTESEQRFRTMADIAPVLIWVSDSGKRFTWFNRTWLDFSGRSMAQEIGFGWAEGVHGEDLGRCLEVYNSAFDSRSPFQAEYRLRRRDGVYRWMMDRGAPRFSAKGEFLGYVGSCTDMTETIEARRSLEQHRETLETQVAERTRQLEESMGRLRQSERMAAIGTLSAGVGHDMGNLLMPIRARLQVLAENPTPEETRVAVDAISSCVEYLQKSANGLRLLALDPEDRNGHESTDLSAWWEECSGLLKNALPRGASLEHDIPDGLPPLAVARHQLTQAVFNVVQNAGEVIAGRTGGVVRIWAAPADGGGRVCVGVSDNGPGMSEEVRARCLEPFFSTKPRGISTGLGLALVQGIVRSAGGEIDVRSTLGAGTTVAMTFRLAGRAQRPVAARPLAARVRLAEPRMRSLAESILRSRGFSTEDGPADSDALLVISDAGDPMRDEMLRHVAAQPRSWAVLFGVSRNQGENPRLIEVEGPASPVALRAALERIPDLIV